MIKSSDNTGEHLLDKYKETRDVQYIDIWKETSGPFIYALRLSNVTSSIRMKYGVELDPYHLDGGQKMEVIEPDIVSYSYEVVTEFIDKWDPDRAKFSTYLYRYGPSRVMRKYREDMWEQNAEEYKEYHEIREGSPEDRYDKEEAYLTVLEIYDTIGIWGGEEDLPILEELKGNISAQEAAQRLGMVYGHSYIKRREDTLIRLRNFFKIE